MDARFLSDDISPRPEEAGQERDVSPPVLASLLTSLAAIASDSERHDVRSALSLISPARGSKVAPDEVGKRESSDSARQLEQGRRLEIRAQRNWKGAVRESARDSFLLQKLFINVLPSISAAL